MKIPTALRLALCIAFLAALAWPWRAATAAAPSKPDILLIVADDQGYADLGVQGCRDIPTPHIDSIARGGTRCTNGYVTGPYCSPTRAALLTGRYQQRYGHEFNPGPAPVPGEEIGLPLTETTLPERLKSAGYATGMVGKWHLGYEEKFHPLKRGFEEFFGFLGGAHSYIDWQRGQAILRGTEPLAEKTYLTDAFTREAVAYLDRHGKKEKPYFLYLAFNAVHGPMEAAPEYLERFKSIQDPKRRTYAAMTAALDDGVGKVLAKIRENGRLGNTLIFYVSDNGGPINVNASINLPLRGQKAQTLEGGIRVPFFVRWKDRVPAGKTYDRPVAQMDMMATALAAAGVNLPSDAKKLDGVNLLPYLDGKNSGSPHEALYWRFGRQMAIRKGDWKLVLHGTSTKPELYNLKYDIGEAHDQAAAEPQKTKELQAQWDAWNAQMVEPKWGPANRRKRLR